MSHANSTLVSIVLTNYNYGHYLRQAIDSAINQTYQFIEVIVVDDGSTDNSKDILESYRGQISVHYNDRTGQCGAINTGFVNSKGSVVIFLDSDDYLEAKAVESHLSNFFVNPDICKSQGYMRCVDAKGKFLQSIFPNRLSASGYYRKQVINQGPWVVRHAWTSGNAWRRAFLQCVLPLPENRKHINSPDGCLNILSTLYGPIGSLEVTVAHYRIHGKNIGPASDVFSAQSIQERLTKIQNNYVFVQQAAEKFNVAVPIDKWWYWKPSWKSNLLLLALSILDSSVRPPGFFQAVLSPYKARGGNKMLALLRSILIVAIYLLPKQTQLVILRRLLAKNRMVKLRQNG